MFVKRFYFGEGAREIKGIVLGKNTVEKVLNLVLYDSRVYCVFHVDRELQIAYRGCKSASSK